MMEIQKRFIGKKKIITIGIIVALVAVCIVLFIVLSPVIKYDRAQKLVAEKKYDKAITIYQGLGDYKDSKNNIISCKYEKALLLMNKEKYQEAKKIFCDLKDFKDTQKNLKKCNHMIVYNYVLQNGKESGGARYIDNPDTGAIIIVKNEDKSITMGYDYYIDKEKTSIMYAHFEFLSDSSDVRIAYELESSMLTYRGEGVFYPHLYDGNFDNTTEGIPDDKICVKSNRLETSLWIEDVNRCPFMDIDFYTGPYPVLDELGALQYYVDYSEILEGLAKHIEYIDCGVSISDLGIDL